MGVIRKEYMPVVANLKVEPAVHTVVGFHAVFQLLGGASVELCHRHRTYSVLNIDGHGLAKSYTFDTFNGRNEVESYFSVFNDDVLCVEVARIAAVGIGLHALLNVGLHLQVCVDDKGAAGLD